MSDTSLSEQAGKPQLGAPEAAPEARTGRRPGRNGVTATLAIISAGLAALFAAGSVWLHAVGIAYQGAYLGRYGVPAGMFPAGASELMYFGYLALLERGVWATTWWIAQPGSWLAIAAVYVYARVMRRLLPEAIKPAPNLPKWLAWAIREFLVPLGMMAGVVLVVLLLIFFLWGVVSPGHYAGLRQAEKELSKTDVACLRCLSVETGSKTLTGRLLAATTTDIAIYVPAERRSHVISRSEITSLTSSMATEPPDQSGTEEPAASTR